MNKQGCTRRIVEQQFQDISTFVKPLRKQIMLSVDNLLIQHARNIGIYENYRKNMLDKDISSLTEEYIKDKEYIENLKKNVYNNKNILNNCIIEIRKLQDKIREKLYKRKTFFVLDTICSSYNNKIASLISHVNISCDINNIKECMKYVGDLYNTIYEFRIEHVNPLFKDDNNDANENNEIIMEDKTYYCNQCEKDIYVETDDNYIVCTTCGRQIRYIGCKDTFKNIQEFNKWLSRSDIFDMNISHNNNNYQKTRQYIRNRVKKRNETNDNSQIMINKKEMKNKSNSSENKVLRKRRSATYKRLNHFRETIKQARGDTMSRINKESCLEIQKLMKIHNIKNEELTPNICRKLQSYLKQQDKSYEVCVSICRILNPNFKVVELTDSQILLLQLKFIQLESVFDEACRNVCPERKNFPSYPQIYYRLSQDIGLHEDVILQSIKFLKSSKLLHNADILHFEMCRLLGWNLSMNRETISYF